MLCRENGIHALLADGGIGRYVVVGVKSDQRPDGAVDALLFDPIKAVGAVGLHQIPTPNRGRVLTDGGKGNDQTGVFGGLAFVKRAVHVDPGGGFIDGCNDAVIVIGKVCVVFFKITATGKTENRPLACARAKDRFGNRCGKLCQSCVERFADVLRCTGRVGFSCGSNRYLGVTGRGNNSLGKFVAISAINPQIPRTCRGECDRSTGVGIGGYAANLGIKLCSVVDSIIGNVKEDRIVFKILCSLNQLDATLHTRISGILMGHIAFVIGKVMESKSGIHIEVPACKSGKTEHVTRLQHDLIRGGAPSCACKRILTVQIVVKVFILSEKSARKVRASGATRKSNFTEITAVKLLVCVNDEL